MGEITYKFAPDSENKRFAAFDGNTEVGEVTYVETGKDILIIDHTFVEDDYGGKGIAFSLVKHVIDLAQEQNKKIIPLCPFVIATFKKTPEYADVWQKE